MNGAELHRHCFYSATRCLAAVLVCLITVAGLHAAHSKAQINFDPVLSLPERQAEQSAIKRTQELAADRHAALNFTTPPPPLMVATTVLEMQWPAFEHPIFGQIALRNSVEQIWYGASQRGPPTYLHLL